MTLHSQPGDHAAQDQTQVPIPAALEGVALVAAKTAAATGQISISLWHDLVRTGRAPAPVIRGHRYTRWRLVDVRAYWAKRATGSV